MAKVNIKPIGDRVLVQHIEEKEQVRGGIIIPDSAKEKPQEAKVIALGTGKRDESGKVTPFEVKVGDRVLISKYGGTEVKIEGKKLIISMDLEDPKPSASGKTMVVASTRGNLTTNATIDGKPIVIGVNAYIKP